MLALIQRVNSAKVVINHKEHSGIDEGLLIFLAIHKDDNDNDIYILINKIIKLKLFPLKGKYFDKDIISNKGSILVVPQFTLYGKFNKGTRPSFTDSMQPKKAISLYNDFCDKLEVKGIMVKRGVFGAHMNVVLDNDGPATFIINSRSIC